jgi:hypothetical protein
MPAFKYAAEHLVRRPPAMSRVRWAWFGAVDWVTLVALPRLAAGLGLTVCDGCGAIALCRWERARGNGWRSGTFTAGEPITVCPDCLAGMGPE